MKKADMRPAPRARRVMLPACLCLCLCLFGCSREFPAGTVATVNGRPISLRLLNAVHEQTHPRAGVADLSVDALRRQYGSALATLIAYSLVTQELQKQGLGIDPERVRAEEARLREDYPGGEFEQILLENQMDIQIWRELLQSRLALERFADQLAKKSGGPAAQEIREYYDAHRKDFSYPASLYVRLLVGTERSLVETARQNTLDDPDAPLPAGVFEQKTVLAMHSLPEDRRRELESLKPGEISRTRQVEGQHQAVQLLKRMPAAEMSIVEAYPVIERMLMEEKTEEMYGVWLERAAASADIRVSVHLREPAEAPEPGGTGAQPPAQ